MVRRAVESVCQQTYENLEIIVVDDASIDGTAEVIAAIPDKRIRYLRHDQNKGGAAARNTGIRAASGEYIAFLDDDDEWEPSKAEIQVAALANYDAVLAMSTVGSEENVRRMASKATCRLEDLRAGMPPVGGTSALMAQADVLKELLFDETLPRSQDWDLLIRLARRCTIGYVPKRLVRYNSGSHLRITNAGVVGALSNDEVEKRLRVCEKHREFFGERWYKRHVSRALLYGIRHQPDKLRRLLDAIRRCGIIPVLNTLTRRLGQILTGTA
jgi:glycosyltransferase involved in cell wall biosynthesis